MGDLSVINSLSLSSLDYSTSRLLTNLLDSPKVLLTEGPIKRHRDWRGLASLVNISSELEATICNYNDKTSRVLQLWMQSQPATVGDLLEHLAALDRYDVYDDVIASIKEHLNQKGNQVAVVNNEQNQYSNGNEMRIVDDHDIITYEDRPGHPHYYHAYILYAEKDKDFVMQFKSIMEELGFEICMKDNLLPGFATQFPPVSKLITYRCQRIVLVYSPEFLQCRDNTFFRDYAQAVSIQLDRRILLPIMYRMCDLPLHLNIYHKLYYDGGTQVFWDRLIKSMEVTRYPRIDPRPARHASQEIHSSPLSSLDIQTMSDTAAHTEGDSRFFLPSNSVQNANSLGNSLAFSTISLPQSLDSSDILKKKPGVFKKFSKIIFRKKKNKSKIHDA